MLVVNDVQPTEIQELIDEIDQFLTSTDFPDLEWQNHLRKKLEELKLLRMHSMENVGEIHFSEPNRIYRSIGQAVKNGSTKDLDIARIRFDDWSSSAMESDNYGRWLRFLVVQFSKAQEKLDKGAGV